MESDTAKLVLAGPVGAGKTTAIRSLTDCDPISTDMPLSEGVSGDKTTTTVAMDFSAMTLDDGTPLLVYGIPGQERFSFMRPIILQGAFGVAVIVDGSDADVASHCTYWLKEILAADENMPIVIGVTHTDLTPAFSMGPIREAIRNCGVIVPAFTFDPRDRVQTSHLIRALLITLR